MEKEHLHTAYTQSIMAGFFAGLVATVISLIYNLIFRGATGFRLSAFINVSSIIFAIPLLLLPAGFIYHLLSRYKSGAILYTVLFILLTALCILLDINFHRSPDPILTAEFRNLLLGIIIITDYALFSFLTWQHMKQTLSNLLHHDKDQRPERWNPGFHFIGIYTGV